MLKSDQKPAPKRDVSIPLTIASIAGELEYSAPEAVLWVMDEHSITQQDIAPLKNSLIHFVSDRIDQFKLAEQVGLNAQFSDFSFKSIKTNELRHVFFRVCKERALVHHIINQSYKSLPLGGTLWLVGYKNEGIKTHISRASQLFGRIAKVTKGKSQLSIAAITKTQENNELLDDLQYQELRLHKFSTNQILWTKPGIYGWDKIDQGSLFLKETLKEHFNSSSSNLNNNLSNKKILDLGCGYGYLSSFLAEQNPKSLVATDNCAAAISATEKNLHKINDSDSTQIIASDAGDIINGKFDFIVSNPPFHQGFATNEELHQKFLANTKRLLAPKGQAWYVVNQFLPLEKHCLSASLVCEEVARNQSFKIILIQHP